MSNREMSRVLRFIDLLSVAACLFVAVVVIPGVEARGNVPAGAVVGFDVGVAPLLVLAFLSWRLFGAIGRDETFTHENARTLTWMAYVCAADALVWLTLIVLAALTCENVIFSVYASLSVALIFAVVLGVVCAALSRLTENAAQLKDENDLVV